LRGVANDQIKTVDIYKGVVPFVVIQLVVIVLIFIFPEIATILPKIIFN
jgi:TRAP-type mannitol/chloroaromatic compound transport system permease large subunit